MGRVLVSGLLVYDSGKTWLGLSLVRRLLLQGVGVGVFKPVAGHDAWHQYSTVVESFRRGVLVGEDVARYAAVVGDSSLELMNPIDVLLAPPNPLSYLGVDIYAYLSDLEDQFKQIVLARLSLCRENSTHHFIFRSNLERVAPPLRRELERLSLKLSATEERLEDFIGKLRSSEVEDELMRCLSSVERGRDVVVIESFNNAIAPFRSILNTIDILVVVAPSAAAVYQNIGEVLKAVEDAVNRYGERGFESTFILSRVEPSTTLYLKPRAGLDEHDESIDLLARIVLSL